MKNMKLLLLAVVFLWGTSSLFAQINSGGVTPTVPFGSNLSYDNGIMPTNLPTSGEFKRSQSAADQYNFWLDNFVEKCSDNSYRVKFDNPDQTVSEGIAYGMLLSAYAGDKVHFDGFHAFFKKSVNSNGLMNWMTDGCSGNARDNSATDAELDIAHALMIASEQWPNATEGYEALAKDLISKIMLHEIDPTTKITWSGDSWKDLSILNPSYQSPAYYRQYAEFYPTASFAGTWASVATASENLLTKNADGTTGLVSNWCDISGTANANGPNNPYVGYGSDACRTPWRMATDVLWHGSTTASVAFGLSKKMSDWLSGHENNLRGQMAQSATSPDDGAYSNGSYTTFALAPMAMGASYQESLNKCYSFTAAMSHDYKYFNETVRTLSLFVLTGNFWKPGTGGVVKAPEILSAGTNETGTEITVAFTQDIASNLGSASDFVVAINGTDVSNAVTGIAASGTDAVILTVKPDVCVAGKGITLSYKGSTIESLKAAKLKAITGLYVKNNLLGNSTLIDNCDDGNATNLLGGVWFTYNDADADDNKGGQAKSTVTPLSTKTDPLPMLADGAEGSAKAVRIEFDHDAGTYLYGPFVGVGFSPSPDDQAVWDLTGTSGISFWHRGAAVWFMVELTTITDSDLYKYKVAESATWQHITIDWTNPLFAQDGNWGVDVPWEPEKVVKLQWQVQMADKATSTTGLTYLELDFLELNGLPPTDLVSFEVDEATDAIGDDFVTLYTDPQNASQVSDTMLHVVYTPTNATYKEVLWTSANPTVASVRFDGEVTALSSGTVKLTAKSVVDESIIATCEVKVVGSEVLPETINVTAATATTIAVAGTVQLSAEVLPTNTDDPSLIWTSSSTSAAVDANGLVTGVSAGTATIKAISTVDNTVFGEIIITVEGAGDVLVETISGLEATLDLTVGQDYTFSVVAGPNNATNNTLVWESDNAAVTVDQDGKVIAISEGTAIITVSSEDAGTASETCTVTVTKAVVPVQTVDLDETSIQLALNATKTLTATVGPNGASDRTVTWMSNKPAIVSVDANGKLTAKSVGSGVVITATTVGTDVNGDKLTAICAVEVLAGVTPVETVTITQGATLSLAKGTTETLDVTVLPTDADDLDFVWSTLDPTYASVSALGVVEGLVAGTARIVATAADGYGAADTITVTIESVPVSKIIVPATLTIEIGEVFVISSSVEPEGADNKVLSWTSLDTEFATVDGSEITGVAEGVATISVASTDGSNVTESITVTVIDPNTKVAVSSISISDATLALSTGESQSISASVNDDATIKDIIWTTDKPEFATVDANGLIFAVAEGVAVITATSKDDDSYTATCTVTVSGVPVTAITLTSASTVSLEKGKTSQIIASANSSASNTALVYESNKPLFASVDANGLVTAKGAGTAIITITPADGSSVSKTVTVTVTESTSVDVLVTSITLSKGEIKLVEGKSASLSAIQVSPSNATNTDLVWASSNESVATYSNGTVTAVGPGTATIIASSADAGDAVATCVVIVSADITLVGSISLGETSLELSISETSILSATISPSGATTQTVVWESSNPSIAKVVNGTVTALKSGVAVITAKSTDGSGVVASIPVTVKASSSTPLATSIIIQGSSPKIEVNESVTLSATVVSTGGTPDQAVQWISSNSAILTVVDGKVTAKSEGSATISAIAKDGSFIISTVDILVENDPIAVTGINAVVDNIALVVGESTSFTANATPVDAANQEITIISDNSDLIAIDAENGTITALAEGTVKVTFTVKGTNYKKIVTLTIAPIAPIEVDGIDVVVDETELSVGDYAFYTANSLPVNAANQEITISVDKPKLVTIDATKGTIKAIAEGTAVVTFTVKGTTFKKKVTLYIDPVVAPLNTLALEQTVALANTTADLYSTSTVLAVMTAKRALSTAIKTADKVVLSAETQDEVDEANEALLSAIEDFYIAIFATDSDELIVDVATAYPSPASSAITVTAGKLIASVSAVAYGGGSTTVLASDVVATSIEVSIEGLGSGVYTIVVVYVDGSTESVSITKI